MRNGNALRAAGDSHPGLQRTENEDRFHYDSARGIFLVVDGVGGHAAGDQAAETAVAMLRARLERETGPVDDRIREAITIANNEIHKRASLRAEWKGMGCVLTVAVVDNGGVTIGHVGDTRLYKLRHGEIVKVTRDHSPVGEREDANELSEAQAMRHPRRNEVYRDVGAEPHEPTDAEFIDILHVPFEPDAALLLCSDGLTDTVSSSTIGQKVAEYAGHPNEVVRALIDAANDAGGKDNVTVVYVEGAQFANGSGPVAAAPVRQRTAIATISSPVEDDEPAPKRSGRWMTALLTFLLLAVVAAAAWRLGVRLPSNLRSLIQLPRSSGTLVVLPTDSISIAIARAVPGSEVIVEPGEYRERLHLKSGVRVRSRIPRAASVRLPGGASEAEAAIVAVDIEGAEVSGLRIVGDAATPLGVGLFVRNAAVRLTELEISGAHQTAIEVAAGSEATILGAYVHDNPGAGLTVRATAGPRIAHSQFIRNGMSDRAPGAIVIDAGARPTLFGNVFHGIAPESLTGLTPAERAEARASNWFISSEESGGGRRTGRTGGRQRP
jgi:serine/threonine protein phosphatase PrpC